MVPKLTALLLLSSLAASPALGMQEKPVKEKKPTTAYPSAKVEFTLTVSGLTKENADSLKGDLNKLSIKAFECPDCGHVQAVAGRCEACEVKLKERSRSIFQNVMPSADKGMIAFRLAPETHVRLSQIEMVLRERSIQVDREKSDFGKQAILVYQGGTSAADASALQEAFRDAKLANAVAYPDPASKEIHVRVQEGSLKWGRLAELGEDLSKPLRLTDVIWGSMLETATS